MFDRWEQGTISWLEIQRLGSALAFPTLLDVMRRKAAHDAGGNDSDGAQLSFKSFKRLLHSPAVAEQLDLVSEYHTAAYQYRVVEKVLQLLVQGHVQVAELSEARLAYAYHSEHCYGLRCDRRTLIEMRIMRIICMEPAAALFKDAPTPRAVRADLHPHDHPGSQVRSPPRSASRGVQSPLDSCGPGWMLSAPSSTCARSRAAAISVRGDGLACTRGHASGGCTAPISLVSHSFLFCISPGPDCCCCLTRCVALLAEFYGAAGPRARPRWPTRVAGRISGHPRGQAEPCVLLLLASGCWVQSFWTCLSCANASIEILRGW
eukprot:COSAG01_NODE_5301_length_4351_cov_2.957432_1_plen_320_part_00